MTDFVLNLYRFLSDHPKTRILSLILSSVLIVWVGLKVTYDEDITSLLPDTNNGNEKLAFSSLRVKDKIFVLIAPNDSESVDIDELVECTDEFVDNLIEKDSASSLIADVFYKLDEDVMMDAISYLCENFPMFVDESAYPVLDSLITKENIESQMAQNYDVLTSSEGMAMKGMIQADPIGMRSIILKKFLEVKDGMGGSHALYDSHLFTPDSTIAIAYISPSFKSYDSKSGTALVEMIESTISEFQVSHENIGIKFHGAPINSVYNSRQIKKDLTMTVSLSLVIICFVILLCFKNWSTLPMMLAPILYGAFFALTMIYIIKGSMSLLALGIGAIVLGVALSYCLHVITHYKYVSTPEQVLKDQAKPVFLGCLTTIGSFLGLLFTQSDLLKDFGLFASFALVGTTFFSLVFLPHYFNPQKNKKSKKAFGLLERFNAHPFEKHTWLIVLICVIFGVSMFTQRWVEFDSDLTNIGYYDDKVMESVDLFAEKTQNGYTTTYYAASSYDLDSALMTSRKVVAKLDSMKSAGLIHGFSKASNLFLTGDEQQQNIDNWLDYWSDEKVDGTMTKVGSASNRYGIKPSFFDPFKDMLTGDFEPESLYEAGILPDGLMANIIEHTDGVYMVFTSVQLKPEDKFSVGNEVIKIPDVIVVDPMFYASEMVKTVNNDFNIALNISMAFVFLVLLISFRDIKLSILAFLPMAMSWFIVLGFMGLLGLKFNLINIVISTFIFGIGVDYSIFVMEGLLSKAQSVAEPKLLIFHKTAIFFSAVVLMVSTGSLMLAVHPALKSIGIATIIGMSSAVILAYSLQPFLFHVLVNFLNKRGIKTKWLNNK
ncbi:MAG: MMPL family transporter [Bacteroidales bacterium]|nr:MMPL family transporter [Bacteroidales bacterium]